MEERMSGEGKGGGQGRGGEGGEGTIGEGKVEWNYAVLKIPLKCRGPATTQEFCVLDCHDTHRDHAASLSPALQPAINNCSGLICLSTAMYSIGQNINSL